MQTSFCVNAEVRGHGCLVMRDCLQEIDELVSSVSKQEEMELNEEDEEPQG